jgi:hypothetical protein
MLGDKPQPPVGRRRCRIDGTAVLPSSLGAIARRRPLMISLGPIIGWLVERSRRLRLVILDACRDNPFLANMKPGRPAARRRPPAARRARACARPRPRNPHRLRGQGGLDRRGRQWRAQPVHHRDPEQSHRAWPRHPSCFRAGARRGA